MKKFLLVLLIIAIIVGIIFAIKSCNFRKKTDETIPTTATVDENTTTPTENTENAESLSPDIESYKTPFIEANIDFTCGILKGEISSENEENFKSKLNEAYKNHSLPVDADQTMIQILQKYENDEEVITTIKEGSKNCGK